VLQHEDTRAIRMASKALEVITQDIFGKNGWKINNRFCL
jgi:hypothetical protein